MRTIKYKSGYKYQLSENYRVRTPIIPVNSIETEYIELDHTGSLLIRKGYAWDGTSGPTPIDDRCTMRASLVHDALYQLMRHGLLSRSFRAAADKLFYRMLIKDGMWKFRAWYYWWAVSNFAGKCVLPENSRKVLIAP